MKAKGKHYVYKCFVEGELKYVGSGKGVRYKHCTSGTSSCSELNRDFHAGKVMSVEFVEKGLPEKDALRIEAEIISENKESLYNKVVNSYKSSIPNCSRSKTVKILYSNWSIGEDKVRFEDALLDMGIDVNSREWLMTLDRILSLGLAFYIVELPTKTTMLVIDKNDDRQADKWMDDAFSHLAHPDGLYGGSVGLDIECGRC